MLNQTVLGNRRAYADLYGRLMLGDVEREKKLHNWWRLRVEDWTRLHIDKVVTDFKAFMKSEVVLRPSGVHHVLNQMAAEREGLNDKRLALIKSLQNLSPPSATKTAVYKWNQDITQVSKEIDTLNQKYFNHLYGEFEKVCNSCLEELGRVENDLIKRGVCTADTARHVVKEQCLPLVGDQQTTFEKELEGIDKAIEDHNALIVTQLKSVFRYCQGVAHLWDVHELGLAKQERHLQEKLDNCRQKHDSLNQDREANLDIIMDRMRQDSSEQTLQKSLKRAQELLDVIKDGYESFHVEQTHVVQSYPSMVGEELHKYDASVCKFFGVDRRHPDEIKAEHEAAAAAALEEGRTTPLSKQSKHGKKKFRTTGSRVGSRSSEHTKADSPVPLAVAEELFTNKGTPFYVLVVAGEYGAQPDDEAGGESANPPSFITEAPPSEDVPSYLQSADVPRSLLNLIKNTIRLNFLNHLEDWMEQGIDRSMTVVAAKGEELNSELDLKLHLHHPRSRRAELDVHNVRAAELVMHSERVSRHCKGILQALNELKIRFNDMTMNHNKLADKFRKDIEALEAIFINATKSSRLVALTNQLQVEQDKYMDVIRTSLRQFRKHVDDTLHMLRESNARFIKSFKVFSDGGNFCRDEIEDYRKKLEKMALKVDQSEGLIMADLEGMESKRLDQASKTASEFADKFKHHMVDLLFMEKVARWLTNTQVKIKSEVADSNAQAQRLAQHLKTLDKHIDALARPNVDKAMVTPKEVIDSLDVIFRACSERSLYLNCLVAPAPTLSEASVLSSGQGTKVGFTSETTILPVSRPGKQPLEDPSIGVIRTILKTQRTKQRFGLDAPVDGEQFSPSHASQAILAMTTTGEGRDRTGRSRASHHSDTGSKRSSKPGTANTGTTTDTIKRSPSGMYRSKGSKIDRKYYVFGDGPEDGEDGHFLGKIKKVLRTALDGLLAAAEVYYRQKGARPVTRPQALQEIFEHCADILVDKLQSYNTQSDEYYNQCLQEFRGQLMRLEKQVEHLPGFLLKELVQNAIEEAEAENTLLEQDFLKKLDDSDHVKMEHQTQLRPALGHPQKSEQLLKLCAEEDNRNQEMLRAVNDHTKTLQESATKLAQSFLERLSRKTEHLLVHFDNILTVDDVQKGRVAAPKLATSELIRRQNAGEPLADDPDKDKLPRGRNTWPALPMTELAVPSTEKVGKKRATVTTRKDSTSNAVTTSKTTLGHSATVTARDAVYQEYKTYFEQMLRSIEENSRTQRDTEQRWSDNWTVSVNKVKELY